MAAGRCEISPHNPDKLYATSNYVALGATDERAHSAVRFGFGRITNEEQVDEVVDRLADAVKKQRSMSHAG